jgi:hypothetical protein
MTAFRLDEQLTLLEQALDKLEKAAEKRLKAPTKPLAAPKGRGQAELELDIQHEREVNRLLASKLDQTINRLETLLTEEHAA